MLATGNLFSLFTWIKLTWINFYAQSNLELFSLYWYQNDPFTTYCKNHHFLTVFSYVSSALLHIFHPSLSLLIGPRGIQNHILILLLLINIVINTAINITVYKLFSSNMQLTQSCKFCTSVIEYPPCFYSSNSLLKFSIFQIPEFTDHGYFKVTLWLIPFSGTSVDIVIYLACFFVSYHLILLQAQLLSDER